MSARATWLLAAEASRARLFAVHADRLEELEDLAHPQSRLHEQALDSDRPGRTFSHDGTGHTIQAHSDHHRAEEERFARQIAERLEAGRSAGEFGRVILIAAPQFLGLLNAALGRQVAGMVERTIAKNVVRETPESILAQLRG
ncbi:MAG: host attachment protein [Gammaproteobacteria bacterium]